MSSTPSRSTWGALAPKRVLWGRFRPDSPGDRPSGSAESTRAGASTRGVSRLSLAEIARRGTSGRGAGGKRQGSARGSPRSPGRQRRAGATPRLPQRTAPIRVLTEKSIPSPPLVNRVPSPPPLVLSPAVAVPRPRGRSYLDVASAATAGAPAPPPNLKPAGPGEGPAAVPSVQPTGGRVSGRDEHAEFLFRESRAERDAALSYGMTGLSLEEKNLAIGLSLADVNLTASTVAGEGGRIVRAADLPRRGGHGVEPVRSTADVSSDELFARKLHDQLQSELNKEQDLEEESSANLALSLSRNDSDTISPDASPLPDQGVALATHNPYAALVSADDPPSPTPVIQGESSGAVTHKPPPSDFILTLPAATGRPVGAGKPVPASAPASTADVVHARALEESAEG